MKYENSVYGKLKYITAFPDNFEADRKYPVIICMHGAGYRGDDLELLRSNPFFLQTEKLKDFPFILAAPQCNADTWFDLFDDVKNFIKYIRSRDFTDIHRFYIMGASMGGYASWQLAMSMPECFSAAAPVCGGGMYWNAGRLKDVPVWAFHGEKDGCVFPEESKKMVKAVNDNGGNARLTLYPENDHNAWDDTYSSPELYEWFLQHTK